MEIRPLHCRVGSCVGAIYQDQAATIAQTALRGFNSSDVATSGSCDVFWDRINARICPQYVPLVSIVCLAFSILILVYHALRLALPYRPKWSQPFVREFVALPDDWAPLHKKRIFSNSLLLFFVSLCGLVFQTIVVWKTKFRSEAIYPALLWMIATFMIAILRPRTSPISLLLLFALLLISSATSISGLSSKSFENISTILQSILAIIAISIILLMPFRNPDLPDDDISAAFTPPTFELRSPEDNLTLWQFLTVSWMDPLIARGKRQQLHDEDVWKLPYEFQHKYLHENFREVPGTVGWRLIKANCLDLMILTVLGILDLLAVLAVPLLLQQLLQAMENPLAPDRAAITYAGLSLVVRLISAQIAVLSLWYSRRCYERSRGEMITMLYEKMLSRKVIGAPPKLEQDSNHTNGISDGNSNEATKNDQTLYSRFFHQVSKLLKRSATSSKSITEAADAKMSASMGKVLNIMRNDAYEVAQRFWEFQSLIRGPLGLILSIALLWQLIGWSCLMGILVVFVGQCVNAVLARILLKQERTRRAATDRKLSKVSQFVESIRHLRWYGWQDSWRAQIMEARQEELNLRVVTGLWNILISFTNNLAGSMFPVAAFYAYTALAGNALRIDVAFPALQVFYSVEAYLQEIPNLITVLLNARVAIGRIEDFMHEPDKDDFLYETNNALGKDAKNKGVTGDDHGHSFMDSTTLPDISTSNLELESVSFAWPGHTKEVLRDISLSFSTGLNVVCGEVGTGKSALLLAILGELDQKQGSYEYPKEMVAYCAQTPWLQSMTIRENILFSAPFDESRYQRVLEMCALDSDLANFKHGDRSYIGENGIGLSGGQRARVALARAVYSTARILLLDDPISALDHQTAEFVVKRCLTGPLMKDRIVILVTHRTDLCHDFATQIIQIKNGTTHRLDHDDPYSDEAGPAISETEDTEAVDDKADTNADKFVEEEHRVHGGVKARVYWEYIRAGKVKWWFLLITFLILFRLVSTCQSLFMKAWGEAYEDVTQSGLLDRFPDPGINVLPWLAIFALIMLTKIVMYLISQCFMLVIVYATGRQMFDDVMTRVAHATFRFYDITPIGRLMNRLTSDIGTIDGNISGQFQNVATYLIAWIVSLAVIASVTPIFLAFSVLLTVVFVFTFLRFLPTSQSLRRLEMVSLSPLMSNFGALVDGLTTVRAFCAQQRFQNRVIAVTDDFQKNDHFYWSLQSWLMYRFDVISAFSTMIVTLIAVYTGVSPGLTAFVLIAASNFVLSTHLLCRSYGQLEMDFVSVERVVELLHLQQESAGAITPPAWWPTLNGDIEFDNVTIRYAPHLDPSLSSLSFRIRAGSSTAVIGRTGSGKSTLAMALLATVSPSEGKILIDNMDIAEVNKQTLRERITFVAQDPVLFPGSMRQNLDPLNDFSDSECETVLSKICGRHGWKLDTHIEAGGKNLSQGQRQLIGLARTLLRRSPIVILDEATASIDQETAQNIQEVLHEEMKGRTVITIAHRLEAVKNADYCIVLGKGKLLRQGRAQDILKEGIGGFVEEDR